MGHIIDMLYENLDQRVKWSIMGKAAQFVDILCENKDPQTLLIVIEDMSEIIDGLCENLDRQELEPDETKDLYDQVQSALARIHTRRVTTNQRTQHENQTR